MKKLYLLILFSLIYQIANAQDYKSEALTLIRNNLRQLQLQSADDVLISDAYPNNNSGTFMVYIQQQHQGIRVLNSIRTLVFKEGKLVVQQGEFFRFDRSKAGRPQASLKAADALNRAMAHLDIPRPPGFRELPVQAAPNGHEVTFEANGVSLNKIPATLLWVPNAERGLTLAWQVGIHPVKETDSWLVRIDAHTGGIINKVNLTVYCQWGASEVHPAGVMHNADGSHIFTQTKSARSAAINSAAYRVLSYPFESPSHSGNSFSIVINPWEMVGAGNPATTLNWHNDGTTEYNYTRGNNVYAQEDRNKDNLFGTPATSSTSLPNLTFNQEFDHNTAPTTATNQAAAITNLFYWNNLIHDIIYQYGFDEVAGNFQNSNMGRGGEGADYVVADAQDGSGMNNANFSTPPDGSTPRMQMYLFSPPAGSTIQIDGDLDNGVIVHEYGHGISNRLTGGPAQVTCLDNAEQMGEGWSDFYALMLTTAWNNTLVTDGTKSRPIGTYALGEPTTGNGIRDYPYSTDMSINPFTYASVASAYEGSAHFIGSIWATMVWDMTWEIINQTGTISPSITDATATGGNVIAMKLVTEGLKLQPCMPGFVDGRNAILQADTLLYGGKYSCAIWRAFARRGLGINADQGSSDDYTDQTASFDTPDAKITKVADKDTVVEGGEITYTIEVSCGCNPISNYSVFDSLPVGGKHVSGGTYNPISHSISFGTVSLNPGESATFVLKVKNENSVGSTTLVDLDASTLEPWTSQTLYGSSVWSVSDVQVRSTPGSWFIPNIGADNNTTSLTSPALTLGDGSYTELSFWHLLNIEGGYDGGVVEVSADNGETWEDLGPYFIQNGYNSNISNYNPLLGSRKAFSGTYSAFTNTLVNLSKFRNKTIRLRFVFAEDEFYGYEGWYIDDISLKNQSALVNKVFLMNGATPVSESTNITPVRAPLDILSITSGSWNTPTTWSCGCIPQLADTVTINPTHSVVIDGSLVKVKALRHNEGNLNMVNNATLELSNN
ncbi:M36 family metallopeptidase [Telluribacter humicola]|uniref:M36 family metallopeptidase n=1 Tax=Telluribacter humicola TaxID=1720261 RepID=UPI001A9791A1|nr:M36 family metallopeptidase [Telluribacter humicola]